MLDPTKRMQMVLTASPQMLARIDTLLTASPALLARFDSALDGRNANATKAERITLTTCSFVDVAKRLGLSRTTVYRMVEDGELSTITTRGHRRIPLQSVMDLLTNAKTEVA